MIKSDFNILYRTKRFLWVFKVKILQKIKKTAFFRQFDYLLVAGLAGFEPAHDGVKVRCLTAWRQPNNSIIVSNLSLFVNKIFEKIWFFLFWLVLSCLTLCYYFIFIKKDMVYMSKKLLEKRKYQEVCFQFPLKITL